MNFKELELRLAQLLQGLTSVQSAEVAGALPQFEVPKEPQWGDLATNYALRLAQKAHKNPLQIAASLAQGLKESLTADVLGSYIREIKVEEPGFINFFYTPSYRSSILEELIKGKAASVYPQEGEGKKVLIEFVSANPTGPLSVAHGRQAAVGDSLARVLDFLGYEVTREYYLNDEGRQMELLGRSIQVRLKELEGDSAARLPEDGYQGAYILDIARRAQKESTYHRELKDSLDYFVQLGIKANLDSIKKDLEDFGVVFDSWTSQAELHRLGKIDVVLKAFQKEGLVYEKDDAWWFASTRWGDDKDRVVIRSNKELTYLAADIAYHQDKFSRGFPWLINLWGPDHHGYIGRLQALVEALGYERSQISILIVQLATLIRNGQPLQMSTRRGEYITLREVIDEVGKEAARFFFLMRRIASHLDFDLELAKKQTSENPVYYIQYAHARICGIINSLEDKDRQDRGLEATALTQPEEDALMWTLLRFPRCVLGCYRQLDPYGLTTYLQELATVFHKFYDRHRVLIDEAQLRRARIRLVLVTKEVIKTGLGLLGISAPEKM